MLKRIYVLFVSALLAAAIGAGAANISLLSGPNYSDPSQVLPTVNTVIQDVNGGVTGQVYNLPAAVATSGATLQTLNTYILAKLNVAHTFHVKAWGVNDSNADVRTLTFSFGGSTDAVVVTATSGKWACDFWVNEQAASVQAETGSCNVAGTFTAPTNNSWTVTSTAAITTLLEGTAATTGIMTLSGSYGEILR